MAKSFAPKLTETEAAELSRFDAHFSNPVDLETALKLTRRGLLIADTDVAHRIEQATISIAPPDIAKSVRAVMSFLRIHNPQFKISKRGQMMLYRHNQAAIDSKWRAASIPD